MSDFYSKGSRTASIEPLFTKDYMVTFVDTDDSYEGFETFHKLEQAESAAQRWIEYDYKPI